jgi:stage V sporulation protein SpoVS
MPQCILEKFLGDPSFDPYEFLVPPSVLHWNLDADSKPPYSVLPPGMERAAWARNTEMNTGMVKGKPKGKGQYTAQISDPHSISTVASSGHQTSSYEGYHSIAYSSSESQGSYYDVPDAQGSYDTRDIGTGNGVPRWRETREDGRREADDRRGAARGGRAMEWSTDIPFKVSGNSDVRVVAGAIANTARRGSRGLVISACGAASINQAIKSIAVARGAYLADEDFEIDVFNLRLAGDREFKHLVYMNIQFVRSRERPVFRQWTTHKVSASSLPGKVAGAIASALRNGVGCQVSVVGAEAMLKAILSVTICSTYLDIDMDPHPLSLMLWPEFDTIYVNGERRTGVSLYIVPTRR